MSDRKKGTLYCAQRGECQAACPLSEKNYPDQLILKRKRVEEAFKAEGFKPDFIKSILKPTRASPLTLGYRNKAKWILERDENRIKMGVYRPGTHEIVDISHCSVHAPAINEVSAFIKGELERWEVPCGGLRPNNAPVVRYMIVRYSFREKKLLVVFVTSAGKVPGLEKVVKALETAEAWKERVVGIVQNINADPGNVLLGEANRYLKKSHELTEVLGPYRVPVGPLSFLQVNSLQAAYLYKRVKELIGKGPFNAGLDLYSGVGLIAMHLAPVTKRVLAVEEMGPAALEGITAARRNRMGNILQVCGDSLEGIATFNSEWGAPDWVVLNPPRKGCDEKVLAALLAKAPRKLVYVSCNPTTLARDLMLLLNGHPNFTLKSLEPVDMFPQTEHVECLALIENRSFKSSSKPASATGRSGKRPTPGTKSLH